MAECKNCGSEFERARARQKFCSEKCKYTFYNKKAKTGAEKVCPKCGKTFVGYRAQRYCSRSCSLSDVIPSREVTCVDCGAVFAHRGRGRRKRCKACQKVNTRVRSAAFATRSGRVKSPGVGSGGAQTGERNHQWLPPAKRKPTQAPPYRKLAFRAYGEVCKVCGSEESIEVHHIDGDRLN